MRALGAVQRDEEVVDVVVELLRAEVVVVGRVVLPDEAACRPQRRGGSGTTNRSREREKGCISIDTDRISVILMSYESCFQWLSCDTKITEI